METPIIRIRYSRLLLCAALGLLSLVILIQAGPASAYPAAHPEAILPAQVELTPLPPFLITMTPVGPDADPTLDPSETPPTETEPASTPTPEETTVPRTNYQVNLPFLENRFLRGQEPLPERSLYCIAPAATIPDADPDGILLSLAVPDDRIIGDLNVYLDIDHMNTGDLELVLRHEASGITVTLIDRPGLPGFPYGCPNSDIISVLDDEMPLPAEGRCGANWRDPAGRIIPAIAGSFSPTSPLSAFDGLSATGEWTLRAKDLEAVDAGKVNKWCLAPVYHDIEATREPVLANIPASARITNISGRGQALPLDCESRSAVDWAAYYGVEINEFTFFNSLEPSDNPDVGFVGSVWGAWGQIPPNPYGVHVEPVAATLRKFGVPAYAHRPLTWDRVREEVATGNPVFVLVIGASTYNSPPYLYTSLDGHVSQVARYEHSAIIIGYTKDTVTLLDGEKVYTRSLNTFLEGWSALGNMGITASP